jgi:hypothetical protein
MPWKVQMGIRSLAPLTVKLSTKWSWMMKFTLQQLYSQGRKSVTTKEEAGCTPKPVLVFRRGKSLYFINIQAPYCACHSLITTLVLLSWLLPRKEYHKQLLCHWVNWYMLNILLYIWYHLYSERDIWKGTLNCNLSGHLSIKLLYIWNFWVTHWYLSVVFAVSLKIMQQVSKVSSWWDPVLVI